VAPQRSRGWANDTVSAETLRSAGIENVKDQGSELDLNATVQHSGLFYLEPDNVLRQSAYTRLNSSMAWQPSNHHCAVTLWGRNLTNQAVISYGGTLVSGLRTVGYEPPRTYGITFEYHYQ
jgi:iron complex outermembrane receptor protein